MGSLAEVDLTQVLVALIAAVPASLAAVVALLNRRSLRTPSGDPIGTVAERTHDLAAVNTAHLVRQGDDALAAVETARTAAQASTDALGEIHDLVNDRLDRALGRIDELQREVRELRSDRSR